MQSVIDDARYTLNDDAKVRMPDSEGLRYAKQALFAILRLRPDLYIGQLDTAEATIDALELTTPSDFPIEDRYARQVSDYIIFRAESADDEAVLEKRSEFALTYFTKAMVG